VSLTEVTESSPLPWGTTSQKAELIALTRALTLAEGKTANIFTDSKYAYHITHHRAALWEERGFLTTKGTPITNGSLTLKLLKASYLPTKVADLHPLLGFSQRWLYILVKHSLLKTVSLKLTHFLP
jgi:hypothetical protein